MRHFYILILAAIISFAHPHTYIDVYPTIHTKNQKITTIDFAWKIDEMTSSMLIMDFDQDCDGKINKQENNFIYNNYFKDLKEYSFYTDIKIKNKTISFPKIESFKTTIENMRIVYSFSIKINTNIKDVKFDMYDEDFFIAMILKDEFIDCKDIKYKINELDNDFYFGYELEFN
jgi:ABC-type uncharacterized transport system substrate-binding protein